MNRSAHGRRVEPGQLVPTMGFTSVNAGPVSIPGRRRSTDLRLRRFAGYPVGTSCRRAGTNRFVDFGTWGFGGVGVLDPGDVRQGRYSGAVWVAGGGFLHA